MKIITPGQRKLVVCSYNKESDHIVQKNACSMLQRKPPCQHKEIWYVRCNKETPPVSTKIFCMFDVTKKTPTPHKEILHVRCYKEIFSDLVLKTRREKKISAFLVPRPKVETEQLGPILLCPSSIITYN